MEEKRLTTSDPNSYANPDHAKLRHFDLDWKIDFEKKIIVGSIVLHFTIIDSTIDQLTLDSNGLHVEKIICEENGQILKYNIEDAHPNFGSKISVTLPSDQLKKIAMRIFYSTSPSATGLQWLNPNQTSGNIHPFLFSQCQPIHARSFMPCQDTPSVKATYKAVVQCNSNLVVLMSALRIEQKDTSADDSAVAYHFQQPTAVPSYLLAIVAGDLVSKDIGPRSKVWAEREVIDKAAYEFAETEKMLSIAESLCGKYVWQQYDLLVLPPSFPYGGMENPCLTFVTPTLLAGDRSLADVVAHEICHSWTGNLVTNKNWEHFWLNEGFTVFFERKVASRLHGEQARNLSAIQGWHDLQYCIDSRGDKDPLTCLIPNLEGCDPDDAFSSVPYEKGHAFLWYLEGICGGTDEFEPFLRAYVEKFKMQSIDTDTFKIFLLDYFPNKSSELQAIDWEAWLHTPGMPPFQPKFDTALADACYDLYQRWKDWDITTDCLFSSKDLESFSNQQRMVWFDKLLENPLPLEKVKRVNEIYSMSSYTNSEIKFRWYRLCILAKWEEQVDEALNFINKQGRLKFVRPIYRDLYAWEAVRGKTISNFLLHKDTMMHVSVYVLTKDLHLQDK